MNGLTLRISKGGGRKSKTSDAFPALNISTHLRQDLVAENATFGQFVEASNADEQLKALKEILSNPEESYAESMVEFLSTVFFHAENKHPVKRFLAKNITKSPTLTPQFSKALSSEISSQLIKHSTYNLYSDAVNKITPCLENFVPGVEAVSIVDIQLANWLKECLQCCVSTLSNSPSLSSTEKNEIFTLSHTTIRLLLHITNPGISDMNTLITLFGDLWECLKQLLFNDDVPMDTKTVCGILILNMRFLQSHGHSHAWKEILEDEEDQKAELALLLSTDASKLALYSAIANTVVIGRLSYYLTYLIECILGVLERNSSESVYVLGATRTLVAISKNLDKLSNPVFGALAMYKLIEFVWGYLDHYMDSVRHLTAQLMGNVVRYCVFLRDNGLEDAMDLFFNPIAGLDQHRKSYYIAITALISELGADEVMKRIPALVHDVIRVLGVQAVQASATTTLEVLLQKHSKISNTETIYRTWIEPVISYVASQPLDSSVLNVLEGLLVKAVKLDRNIMEFILPTIKNPNTRNNSNLKCTLMLLSVARKCNALGGDCDVMDDVKWKDVIGYDVLQMAAVDAVDETRILSLSLIVESPKSTEPFTRGELDFVLHYLTYNLNEQSPSFRQLTLSQVKKFLKRLKDSYKMLQRQKKPHQDVILEFMSKLRDLCFDSLIPGANYSRRVVALTVLSWCESMQLEGYQRSWREDELEKLIYHLEDSYESNKALALAILNKYPKDMFMGKKYSTSLDLEAVLKQASSLKPTDCVSAAYKLDLLRNKLPEYILLEQFSDLPEPVAYSLLYRLLNELKNHVATCKRSIVAGSAYSPMYPLIHCLGHTVTSIDHNSISSSPKWSTLIQDIISTSYSASEAASPIVNNSSPEGHLPNDLGAANDYGNSHGVTLQDGRQVTAQMVLLCAWRTVKEVSLLLGDLSSLLTIRGEGQDAGSLTTEQVSEMGSFFTRLLAETKHRGAFEQAYVGFMKLLARLWRSRSPELHSLPRQWLDDLMDAIASTEKHPALCSTRRSAGLPFMIQALVTTELQVQSNPKCFHQCMTTLLRLARTPQQNNLPSHSNNSESEGKTNNASEEKIKSEAKKDCNKKTNDDSKVGKIKSGAKKYSKQTKTKTHEKKGKSQTKIDTNVSNLEQNEKKSANSTDLTHTLKADNVETKKHEETTKLEQNEKRSANSTDLPHTLEAVNVETSSHEIKRQSETKKKDSNVSKFKQNEEKSANSTDLPHTLEADNVETSSLENKGKSEAKKDANVSKLEQNEKKSANSTDLTRTLEADNLETRTHEETMQSKAKKDATVSKLEQNEEKSENSTDLTHTLEADNVETRTHAINILRALFRNASLDESVASYVGEGLMVALQGFEGSTWMERNSSTLLFSALMVRIFGVQRSKDGDNLCIRNRMTGRIFFLRYPQLYDAMLTKLQEVFSSEDDNQISPSLYPILLLLARLYPSSLEGTVSNLKLVAFVPYVVDCAASAVMKTRQLAAKAIVPLIPPHRYVPHLEEMFEAICDADIERNTCHGILLQLIKLLEAKRDNLSIDDSSIERLSELVQNTQWILQQATRVVPCYLLADEYVKVVSLLVRRFPSTIRDEYTESILKHLEEILFNDSLKPRNTCGREVCLANCLYLNFILLNKKNEHDKICNLVYKGLRHNAYEVVLSVLNFLLILYENIEIENKFLEHLNEISNRNVRKLLRQSDSYTEALCFVLKQANLYPECRQKTLKILTLEEITDKCVYGMKNKDASDDKCILQLHFNDIKEEHENLTHIYLESLCNFVTKKLEESSMNGEEILEVIRVVFACSSSDNKDETREIVVKFLEINYERLLEFDLKEFNEEIKFEYKATVYATVVTMLEDDNSCLRQRIADTITKYCGKTTGKTHTVSQDLVLPDEGQNITQEQNIGNEKFEKTATELPTSQDLEESLKNLTIQSDKNDFTQDIAPSSRVIDDGQNITQEQNIGDGKLEKTAREFPKCRDLEDSLNNLTIKNDKNDFTQDIAPSSRVIDDGQNITQEQNIGDEKLEKTATEIHKSQDLEDSLKNLTIQSDKNQDTAPSSRVIPTKAAEMLRGSVDDMRILVVLALMDFKSEVYITDDEGDESRVFDTNEKYNIFMEETIWARACADVIKQKINQNTMDSMQEMLNTRHHRPTFDKLCGKNLTAFEDFMRGINTVSDLVNPKVKVFFDTLRKYAM